MKNTRSQQANALSLTLFIFITAFCTIANSCDQQPQTTNAPAVMQQNDSAKKKFTAAMVDNKKDPNCGMPVTAGIEDTVHYNGKVYGFCSDECKQAFLKNPAELAKNADLK
ncbi:MAG TPA: YHS domain-containing protein [Puia sp.]